ncbi:MAG TPA: zinc-binding dehydrogenase [Dehalococcoidia bacterium]|nr:zinc-binding dehydrogenase [Dehalococcoidia bacterium]
MNGRVAVIKAYGKPFELEEYPVPDPEPGAVLLTMAQAGICGSDLHTWRGDQASIPLPPAGRALGHEGAGRVFKLGKGVTTDSLGMPLHEGDRVIHSAIFPCGRCHLCLRGEPNFCPNGGAYRPVDQFPHFVGTYADYYYLPPGHPVFRVPDELSDDVLGPVNCAMGTVTQGLTAAGCGEGQQVVIQGAGGLGLSATAMAKDMGAERVIVLDRIPHRLALAKRFGADETVNISDYEAPQDRIQRVRELTGGRGADLVLELVGLASLMSEGIAMLRNGGTFVEIGNIVPDSTATIYPSQLLRGKKIMGSAMYRPSILPMALGFLVRAKGRYPFEELVSHRFPLAQINEAFPIAEWSGKQTEVTRAVLVP